MHIEIKKAWLDGFAKVAEEHGVSLEYVPKLIKISQLIKSGLIKKALSISDFDDLFDFVRKNSNTSLLPAKTPFDRDNLFDFVRINRFSSNPNLPAIVPKKPQVDPRFHRLFDRNLLQTEFGRMLPVKRNTLFDIPGDIVLRGEDALSLAKKPGILSRLGIARGDIVKPHTVSVDLDKLLNLSSSNAASAGGMAAGGGAASAGGTAAGGGAGAASAGGAAAGGGGGAGAASAGVAAGGGGAAGAGRGGGGGRGGRGRGAGGRFPRGGGGRGAARLAAKTKAVAGSSKVLAGAGKGKLLGLLALGALGSQALSNVMNERRRQRGIVDLMRFADEYNKQYADAAFRRNVMNSLPGFQNLQPQPPSFGYIRF